MSHRIAIVNSLGAGMSFQGSSRIGWRRFGVAPCGPMDPMAATQANTLLENTKDSTVIEIALGGSSITLTEDTWLSHCGASHCSELPPSTARLVKAGETLTFSPTAHGVWSYLAIPGGWTAARFFGSYSYHARSDVGTKITTESPLLGTSQPHLFPGVSKRLLHPDDIVDYSIKPKIRLHRGPHVRMFPDLSHLLDYSFKVSDQSDRTGYRLNGAKISCNFSIKSLPIIPGCIQIPPSGQPIITLNDGPTVGGYPIIAIVTTEDLPFVTQAQPHSDLTFVWHESVTP